MKKFTPLFFVAFVVAACASLEAETPQQRVFAAKTDYKVALQLAVQYNELPRCESGTAAIACSHTSVVEVVRKANDTARVALDEAERIVRDPATTDSALNLAVESATSAVRVFTAVVAEIQDDG